MDWSSKFRPTSLDLFIGQVYVREKLKILAEQIWDGKTDFPHLLFSGDQGTGKTSMAKAFLKHTFGKDWNYNLLEINSSFKGGIDMMRENISNFCTAQTLGHYTTPKGQLRVIPYNFIFLDECDGLSANAQFALRRILEDFPKTRFFFSCNYKHKILGPILDRVMAFHFPPYREEDLIKMIENIVKSENIVLSNENIKLIAQNSDGSARKSQSILQMASLTRGDISDEEIRKAINLMDESFNVAILERLMQANSSGLNYNEVHDEFSNILANFKAKGHSGEDVVRLIYKSIVKSNLDAQFKRYYTKKIADVLYQGHFCDDIYLFIELWSRSLGCD